MGRHAKLVCLLSAHNAADDLPGWFESVEKFADAVVALDDGSTDRTAEMLEAHPLVTTLLTNPRRDGYRGWDDAANRNRLLAAALESEPEWILSLDADERLDAGDAAALREFIASDALPGLAYGFTVYRMIDDLDRYDDEGLWVYRLFAHGPGQAFPSQRLHFVPIPTSIPRPRWLQTTLRIQHVASLTAERRRARFQKYVQADPENAFQRDYTNLLRSPERVSRWKPRPAGLPVLLAPTAGKATGTSIEGLDLEGPALSAVVISRDDEDRIERAVRAVVEQECPEPFEVIVVTSGTDRTAQIVREKFPQVRLVELPKPGLPGEARNAGLRVARGDYVTFPGSHVELPQGSLAARLRAHELGHPMVTGVTLNGTRTWAGWASYFLDHASVLPGRPSAVLDGPPGHCSYLRDLVIAVGGFPEDMRAGEDTVVNSELWRRGFVAYYSQDVALVHHSPCRTPLRLVRHHFGRGRALGRIILAENRHEGRLLRRRWQWLISWPYRRVSWTTRHVEEWGGALRGRYRYAFPLVVAGTVAAWAGLCRELLRPQRGKARVLLGRPGVTILIGGLDRRPGERRGGRTDLLILARIDMVEGTAHLLSVPRDLLVEIPGVGTGRINEAHHYGAILNGDDPDASARLLRETLQRTFGVRVDEHLLLDFEGFRHLVDAFGGVEVNVDCEIHDDHSEYSAHFLPGVQLLDGERALQYARTRKGDGDDPRSDRQLQLLGALLRESRRIRSPRTSLRLLRTTREWVTTSLSLIRAIRLGRALARMPVSAVAVARLGEPTVSGSRTSDGNWVYIGNEEEIAAFVQRSLGLVHSATPLNAVSRHA